MLVEIKITEMQRLQAGGEQSGGDHKAADATAGEMAGMAESREITGDILGDDLVLAKQGCNLARKRMVQLRLGDNQRPLVMPGKLLIEAQGIGHIKTIAEITNITGAQMDDEIAGAEPVALARLQCLIEVWDKEGLGDAVSMSFHISAAEDRISAGQPPFAIGPIEEGKASAVTGIEGELSVMKEVGAESRVGWLLIAAEIDYKGIHDSLQRRGGDHRFANAEEASEIFSVGDGNKELLDVIPRSPVPFSQHKLNFSASQAPAQTLRKQLQPDGVGMAASDHPPANPARFRQALASLINRTLWG